MAELHLYSYRNCPFARRTRMTLLEKNLDFELTEIDLNNKPANFAAISPYGKVPVLLHGDGRLYESAIINEYLDETFPQQPLMPRDPLLRAQARIWMDYCDSRFGTASWALMQAGDDAGKRAAAEEQLRECFQFIEHEGLRKLSDGPWWLGARISLVDIQFMPFFRGYLDGDNADLIPHDCTRLRAWLDRARAHPSFIATGDRTDAEQ